MKFAWSANRLILASATFLAAFANLAFFRHVAAMLAGTAHPLFHGAALGVILWCLLVLFILPLSFRRVLRPALAVLFVLSAVTAYFMDSYNVIIDRDMILSVLSTDAAEVGDLLTGRFAVYLLLLGVLPVVLLWRVEIAAAGPWRALRARLLLAVGTLTLLSGTALLASAFLASFVREHKAVRYYTNPLTPVYSAFRFVATRIEAGDEPMTEIGTDARIPAADADRELVILVVGETARADRFSLNGYGRNTNPELAARGVISFDRVEACGTSTAVSVPCMFAAANREDFDEPEARRTENLLDVLSHAHVSVLWRDNNSDSKGVAERVQVEDFHQRGLNPECDHECRDSGMLAGLQDWVDGQPGGDILIVLHQLGSHGPAYHKRYPEAFEIFVPVCDSEELADCTAEEIGNSYDNSIRYTDYFLARVLDFLAANDDRFETAMLYVGDHGESLGEDGLWLHGMPYWLAPGEQIRVPMILWFGRNYDDVDAGAMRRLSNRPLSHDNLFHTVLGLFEIQTGVYDPDLDVLQQARGLERTPSEYGG